MRVDAVEHSRLPSPRIAAPEVVSNSHILAIDIKENRSKCKAACFINKKGAKITGHLVTEWLKYHGPPKHIMNVREAEVPNNEVQNLCQFHGIKHTATGPYFSHQNSLAKKSHAVAERALERIMIITGIVLILAVIIAKVILRHRKFRNQEYLHILDRNAINEEITEDQKHTKPKQPRKPKVERTQPELAPNIPSSLSVAPIPDLVVQNRDTQNKSETVTQKDARSINLDSEDPPSHYHQPIPSTTVVYKTISSMGSSDSQ